MVYNLVCQPLHSAVLVPAEDLVAGLAGDSNSRHSLAIFSPSSRRATNRSRSSIVRHSRHGICVASANAEKCHPCLRNTVSERTPWGAPHGTPKWRFPVPDRCVRSSGMAEDAAADCCTASICVVALRVSAVALAIGATYEIDSLVFSSAYTGAADPCQHSCLSPAAAAVLRRRKPFKASPPLASGAERVRRAAWPSWG